MKVRLAPSHSSADVDQSKVISTVRHGIPVVVLIWVTVFIYTHSGQLGIGERVVKVIFNLGKHSDLHTDPGVGSP